VLELLIESDGRDLPAISEKLVRTLGIEISDQQLWRYWRLTQTRLRKGDVILTKIVEGIIAAKLGEGRKRNRGNHNAR
jgi:predicted metal-dependent phosphoesterase TrpH